MDKKELFWLFPDYPAIKPDSKTSTFTLISICQKLSKEEIDEIVEEYVGLGIIELRRNDEYVLTPKGWDIWNKEINKKQQL